MNTEEMQVSGNLDRGALEEQVQRRLSRRKSYKPFIAFSRDPGSGGRPIAELVAKKLGYKIFDKELINKISEKMHQPVKLIKDVDEKERSSVMDFVQTIFNPDYVSDESYFRLLYETVLEIVEKGAAVIIGRGCNFIAPRAYGLNVQVIAPYQVRVARAIQYEHINYHNARAIIRDITEEREGFIQQYFGKDMHAPKYYDLTINTAYFTIEQAADIVIQAYRAKFPETTVVTTTAVM